MLKGRQEPRIRICPECAITYGGDACELAEAYGKTPDEWQAMVLDAMLAEDGRGQYASLSVGLSVPRQNGKNAVIEFRELYGSAVLGEIILHTAHRVDTARKAFIRLAAFFEDPRFPEMGELVKTIRRTNGQECIELANGGCIEFSSRVNGGKRGFTADVVVFDEAQELTDDQLEAIMSTMAAAPSGKRQMIYAGTPPTPVSPGTVFRRERKAAMDGAARKCWLEWSVPDIPQASDWEEILPLCYETNPALGIRLDVEFTENEFRTLSPEGFARERLGWWSSADRRITPVIQRKAWNELISEPPTGGVFVYGVKFSPDGATVALSGCMKPDDGNPFVELITHEPTDSGVGWLVDFVVERKAKAANVVVDGKAGAQAFIERMIRAGVPKRMIVQPRTDGITAACAGLLNAVNEKRVNHSGQEALAESATMTERRKIGNSGGWGFESTEFAAAEPIESVALAHWQACATKRKPGRKATVW